MWWLGFLPMKMNCIAHVRCYVRIDWHFATLANSNFSYAEFALSDGWKIQGNICFVRKEKYTFSLTYSIYIHYWLPSHVLSIKKNTSPWISTKMFPHLFHSLLSVDPHNRPGRFLRVYDSMRLNPSEPEQLQMCQKFWSFRKILISDFLF